MYLDVVLCEFKESGERMLYRAPAWSSLEAGDDVYVDDRNGCVPATVIRKMAYGDESEEFKFLLVATKSTLPLPKIVSKVVEQKFVYGEVEV